MIVGIETPVPPDPSDVRWGSDYVADVLRALDIPFICLNPGASFRGLHDSLVNHLGNATPRLLLCLHEEHGIAIAHGYAKVTGRGLAVAVHSNVGLMHASMAIYNAWCDRVPILVIGATGPVDAASRRPWIDWIHTAQDQGALVRSYTKWDDQPASVPAAQEAVLRAHLIAHTAPRGPVYVCLDAALQESRVDSPSLPDLTRHRPPSIGIPPPDIVRTIRTRLQKATKPVILAGRVSRDPIAWHRRVRLAEAIGAKVVTDLKVGAAFPTDHPLHVGPPAFFLPAESAEALKSADVILSLDWLDLGGTLKQAFGSAAPSASVINFSLDQLLHNGWSKDHQGLPPLDFFVLSDPDEAVALLLEELPGRASTVVAPQTHIGPSDTDRLGIAHLASGLRAATAGQNVCLIRLPLGWNGALWSFHHPLDYLGYDGGGGIGSGPGMAVGAALALKGTDRLPVAILGDGDFLMGVTAIWTACRYNIPLLIIVANNRSFFNDEIHQERVALDRKRPVENRWIGQRIAEPEINLAAMAQAQGAVGFGPLVTAGELETALQQAVAAVRSGGVAVVDARVIPGYDGSMTQDLMRSHQGRE